MKTILVVEDDPTHMKIIADLLGANGYRVEVARTGPKGVKCFLHLTPDMVLIDVNLPEKTGFDVAAEIRAAPTGRDVPIVLMSAVSEHAGILEECERLGIHVNGYLAKPFRLVELLGLVEGHIKAP